MSIFRKIASFISMCLCALVASAQVPVGFRQVEVADSQSTGRAMRVALWYPVEKGAALPEPRNVAGNRVFEGVLVHPDARSEPGAHPVVLMSHGTLGHWGNQAWLAHALAQRGYVVAAPNHPGTSFFDKRRDQMQALWHRPADLSRVLDALLANPQWAGQVRPDNVAAIGHSLGAWTALVLAGGQFNASQFASDCRQQASDNASCSTFDELGVRQHPDHGRLLDTMRADPRIRAAVLLDIGAARGFTAKSLASLRTPVLLVAAGQPNPTLPEEKESRAIYAWMPRVGTEYARIAGATHFTFIGLCTPQGASLLAQETPDESFVCKDGTGSQRVDLHSQVVQDVTRFLAKHLSAR